MNKNKELRIIQTKEGQLVTDSRDVARMVEKDHSKLLRDIRGYIKAISTNPKLDSLNFFIEDSYKDNKGEIRPCYLLTKKGCDMVANKLTGTKGVLFTAEYVTKFEAMEEELKNNRFKLPRTYKEALICLVEAEEEKEKLQEKIEVLEPKADYTDKVLNSNGLITINTIAKDYDYTAQEMNQKLHELGIQYKQGKRWFLYKRYCGNGYVFSNTKLKEVSNESEVITHWTQKGKAFLYKILKANKIVPITEKNNKKIKRIV